MVCEACGGTGECGPCDGYGSWDFPDGAVDCGACVGDGECADCAGSGETSERDEIERDEMTELGVGE
jgi:hypothetical protein